MKSLWRLACIAIVGLGLVGCASPEQPDSTSTNPPVAGAPSTQPATTEAAAPLSLAGEWEQSNKASEDSYQIATITDTTIEIYWMNADTKALFWAGSFIPPTDATDTYSWTSDNDKEKTGSALLASSSDTKDFTYSKGELSYEVTAMGMTTTVILKLV